MVNFDQLIDRRNSDSSKWNGMKPLYGTNDLLPMWVADMDFAAPEEVTNALSKRVSHGVFGYAVRGNWPEAVRKWMKKRHGWDISEGWLLPSPGVVSAIAFSIQALTEEGDRILVQTPVYAPFYQMIENNGRQIARNPLVRKDGRFTIDFENFEDQLKSGVKLFILCSPHNPVGRVWTEDELRQIGELCLRYGVPIISDEIHSDIVYHPAIHHPIASLDPRFPDHVITCIAPSKTFNIPGLQGSAMIIPNADFRSRVLKAMGRIGFHGFNVLAATAMVAAYRYGEPWLEQLLQYLNGNIERAVCFINEKIPGLSVTRPEGTYLLWIDFRNTGISDEEMKSRLINAGLALESGPKFGEEGRGFLRMNVGCPRATLEEGLKRLQKAVLG